MKGDFLFNLWNISFVKGLARGWFNINGGLPRFHGKPIN
jgi:hypothetical protein